MTHNTLTHFSHTLHKEACVVCLVQAHYRVESKSRLCRFLCCLDSFCADFCISVLKVFPLFAREENRKALSSVEKCKKRSRRGQDETSCAEGENSCCNSRLRSALCRITFLPDMTVLGATLFVRP